MLVKFRYFLAFFIPFGLFLGCSESEKVNFTTSPEVELIVLNNKKWFYFETKGTTHNLLVRPNTGSLAIMARKKGTKGNYSYFMEYKVGG